MGMRVNGNRKSTEESLEDPAKALLVEPFEVLGLTLGLPDCLLFFILSLELGLFGVNDISVGVQIDVLWLNEFCLLDELVTNKHDDEDWKDDVTSNERLVWEVSVSQKDSEVLDKNNKYSDGEGKVGTKWLHWGTEVQVSLSVETLGLQSLHETHVQEEDTCPGNQTSQRDDVDEVCEDLSGGGATGHESQATESSAQEDTPVRDTHSVGVGKELWCVAGDSKTVDGSGCDIQVRVGSGQDEKQNTSVDDVVQALDVCVFDGNDEWRSRSGGAGCTHKQLVVGGDTHSEKQNGADVEHQNTVEGQSDGLRDGLSWSCALCEGDTNQLGASVSEGGDNKDRQERDETSGGALDLDVPSLVNVVVESAGVLPVAEAQSVVGWTTAQGDDKQQDNQADTGEHLQAGQPEFDFTEEADTQDVHKDDDREEDGNPDSRVDLGGRHPETHDQGAGNQLVGGKQEVLHQVHPTASETKRLVDVSGHVTCKTISQRDERGDLTQSTQNHVHNETEHRVRDEHTSWAGGLQSRTGTDQQTSTQRTADGNHRQVSCLQGLLERLALGGLSLELRVGHCHRQVVLRRVARENVVCILFLDVFHSG